MSRPLRIQYDDALYHVTARGNARGPIVADDADRTRWIATLKRAVDRRDWRIFAFVLLDNHYHLFLETPHGDLSAGMRDLNGNYAGYFNARHARPGHFFQGRFHAVLIESQGHWSEVSRYVHLNPVRAGLVQRPEDWRWSSYPGYCWRRRRLPWVGYSRVLADYGGDTEAAVREHRRFVDDGLRSPPPSPLAEALHGTVLGSAEFTRKVEARVAGRRDNEVPALEGIRRRCTLERVIDRVAGEFGEDPDTWRPGRRMRGLARSVAAYVATQRTEATFAAIAKALGYLHVSSVRDAIARVESALPQKRVRRAVQATLSALS